jgi:hypothetical protein
MGPLRLLVAAVKTTNLTYRLITTSILIGQVVIISAKNLNQKKENKKIKALTKE